MRLASRNSLGQILRPNSNRGTVDNLDLPAVRAFRRLLHRRSSRIRRNNS